MRFFLLPILPVVFLSCHANDQSISTGNCHGDCNQIKVEISEELLFSDIVDSTYYVKLETNKNCLIGEVSKVIRYGDTLFVLDRMKAEALLAFHLNGKFLFKVGSKGRGEGEYRRIQDFCIDPQLKTIYLLDGGRFKLLEYNLSGDFIREGVQFDDLSVEEIDIIDNYFAVYTGNSCFIKCNSFYLFDRQGNLKYTSLPADNKLPQGWAVNNHLTGGISKGLVSPPFSSMIYEFAADSIYPIAQFDFGELFVDYAHLQNVDNIHLVKKIYGFRSIHYANGILLFSVPFENKILLGFSNLQAKTIHISGKFLYKTLDSSLFFEPVGTSDDFYISSVDSKRLFDSKMILRKSVRDSKPLNLKISPQLLKLIHETDLSDNPVLQFTAFKNI